MSVKKAIKILEHAKKQTSDDCEWWQQNFLDFQINEGKKVASYLYFRILEALKELKNAQ